MCFRCFDIISRSEKNVALYFNKLEFPSPSLRILCAQFGWNWPNGCEEEYIIKISKYGQCISLFRHYITLGKRVSLHLNKIEFPSPKNASCQIRLKSSGGSGDQNVKSLQTNGQTTVDRRSEKLIWAFNVEKLKNYLT